MALTPKQERFVAEYLVDLNATQAYIRAGYSETGAAPSASALLRNPKVAAAVAARTAKVMAKVGLTEELIVANIYRPLAADVRKMFKDGKILPIDQMEPEEASLVAAYDTVIENAKAGDNKTDEVLKIRLVDKAKWAELGMKYLGLIKDRAETTVNVDLRQIIQQRDERLLTVGR